MSDLTGKFAGLQGQMSDANTDTQSKLTAIVGALDFLNTQIETLNLNGATNTRYLLQALAGLDPCAECAPGGLIVTPPTTDPFFPGAESCKRAQAFVSFLGAAASILDVVSGLGTGTFVSLVTNAYNEVIESSAMFAGVPSITFTEGAQLVGLLVDYGFTNIGRGDTLRGQFDTLASAIQSATFNTTSAASAKAAYQGVINSSGLPADEKDVLIGMAYDGLFTFFFDPASSPDLDGFSGTACGTVDTICATSTGNEVDPDGTHNVTWFGTDVTGALADPGEGRVFDQGYGDFTFTLVSGTSVLAVSFVPGLGSVVTYPLPALVLADPTRRVYVRDAVTDCVINVCISPAEA